MRSFILKSFEQINASGKVKLFKSCNPEYADGEYKRDFVYVKDAVDMTLFFLDNPKISGLFNIATGKARTWNDMVKACFAAMKKPAKIEFVEMPENLRKQYQYFTEAKMSKLHLAGYNKKTMSLESSVTDYIQNHLNKHISSA
jgi:ADP-L-glycero-D-manno-heptose 6-epimerase